MYLLFFLYAMYKIAKQQEEGKGMVDLNWSVTSNEHSYFQRNQRRSEVESYATSSGQLALLARLTHAIPFFLATTQRILPPLRILAKSFPVKLLWRNVTKFSLAFYAFRWNREEIFSYLFFSISRDMKSSCHDFMILWMYISVFEKRQVFLKKLWGCRNTDFMFENAIFILERKKFSIAMRLQRFSRRPVKFLSGSYKFPWLLSLNYFTVSNVSRFVTAKYRPLFTSC